MQNIDQIFLYMKDEIEKQAKNDEQMILDEVKKLEDDAYEAMKAEAKRDAELRLKQEEDEINSNASTEISESHIERTKRIIEKRDEYVKAIFDKACQELMAFSQSDEYKSFLIKKMEKVSKDFDGDSVLYLSSKDLGFSDDLVNTFGKNIEVKVDDRITIGGFILENLKSHLVVDETLDFALNNQKGWFNKNSGLIIK